MQKKCRLIARAGSVLHEFGIDATQFAADTPMVVICQGATFVRAYPSWDFRECAHLQFTPNQAAHLWN